MARDHALARRRRLSLVALAEYPAVLPGVDTFTGQIVHRHFEAAGVPLQLRMATNYLETLRMMAAVGLGWTVLPQTMASPELRSLTLSGTALTRTLGLVYHRERSLSRAARAFIDLLRDGSAGKRAR